MDNFDMEPHHRNTRKCAIATVQFIYEEKDKYLSPVHNKMHIPQWTMLKKLILISRNRHI